MWNNKQGNRCYRGKESSWKRRDKDYAKVIWHLCNDCSDIWNGSTGKYKISGNDGNRENTRKGIKKDISTSTGIIMETWIWPAEQKIQYATMMLYHNINNSDDNRKVKQVVDEQEQNQFKNTLYQTVKIIAKIYKLILVMPPQPVNQ